MNPFVIALLLMALIAVSGCIGFKLGRDHASFVTAAKLHAVLGDDELARLYHKLERLNNTVGGNDNE